MFILANLNSIESLLAVVWHPSHPVVVILLICWHHHPWHSARLVLIICSFFVSSIDWFMSDPSNPFRIKSLKHPAPRCVMVMYPSKHFLESFGSTKSPFPKNHHQLWDTQKFYPFNKGLSPKHLRSPKRPVEFKETRVPSPTQADPRLASAWTKIFKVAASWSRHVFDKTPWRNYGFFRDLNITTFGPVVFTIYSLHTSFLRRAQVYIRMVVHHWSAKIFNMIHSCKAFIEAIIKAFQILGKQTLQSHPQKTWCLTSYPL